MFLWRTQRHYYLALLVAGLAGLIGWIALGEPRPASTKSADFSKPSLSRPDRINQARISEAYGRLPLSFEANHGQTDREVKFISRGNGYSLFLTPTEAVMELRIADCGLRNKEADLSSLKSGNPQPTIHNPQSATHNPQSATRNPQLTVLEMRLIGANAAAQVDGVDELPGKNNYFTGNDPQKWSVGVPNYGKVRYKDVYPGVDLVYHGNQSQLEYDFIVSPGASPKAITLDFQGASRLEVDAQGDLVLETAGEQIRQQKPLVYQESGGIKQIIAGSYIVKGEHRIGFKVADYDLSKPLIIDPVLSYSTYLGGGGSDSGNDIAIDSAGNAYVVGTTNSINFPTSSPFQASSGGGQDTFVAKLNATGNALVYSTFLGGGGDDFGSGIAVDSAGNVYVTGDTSSTNFPTVNPLQSANASASVKGQDAFVTKLNAAGNALVYSTYLGGSKADAGFGIAVDSAGNAYVAGITISTDFPTAKPLQAAIGGDFDLFVTKLNPAGSALIYSTYLGGSDNDFVAAITVDSGGNAYLVGSTSSANFPTAKPLQAAFGGGSPFGDAFVAKLNPEGSALVFSTYLGGSGSDFGGGIAVDSAGNVYVTGGTLSKNFPTASPLQSAFGGGTDFGDAFVAKLNPAGSALVYSTYLGGSGDDFGSGIAVDSAGNVYVTGSTGSADFPTASPLQATFGGGIDAFVTKLNPAGSALIYSTYLGGAGEDRGTDIAVDSTGSAYMTGSSDSINFPIASPLQAVNNGTKDAFITKVVDTTGPPLPTGDFSLTINPSTQTVAPGSSTSFTIGLQVTGGFAQPVNLSAAVSPANSNVSVSLLPSTINPGSSATLTVSTTADAPTGTFTITVTGTAGQLVRAMTATLDVTAPPDFALVFNPATLNVKRGQKGQITVNINRTGGFAGSVTVTAPDTKSIKVKLTPPTQSTTGTSVNFDFKIKKKAPRGTQQLTFTGRDETGRTRTGTLTLMIQ